MDKKRICLLINKLARGGAETQCVRLAKGLRQRGWQVRIITLLPSTAFTDELTDTGIQVIDVSRGRTAYHPYAIVRLIQQLRDFRPDVLVTFLYQADIVGRLFGRVLGIPVRITSIRNEFFGASGRASDHWSVKFREELIRRTDSFVHRSTTNSELAANSLIGRGIVPRDRMRVIRNMIDLEPFAPMEDEERAAFRLERGVEGDSVFVWVHAGRLETQKDHATLLRAFSKVRASHPDSCLWLLGDGSRRAELEAMTAELDLKDHVVFAGERSDVPDWLRAADAFVLSSSWEGLPNVLLEAGAAGLPIVSTNVGGVREAVSEKCWDYLVPPGDGEALAQRMSAMIVLQRDDPGRFDDLGQKNHEHVRMDFSSDGVLDQWEGLFAELAEPTQARRKPS